MFVVFQDGAIRGLNVAKMIRSLTSGTLSGWQEKQDQATDLTQFSASFQIDKGQAATTDLKLVGPLVKMTGIGTIDLGTKQIAFRVEPKLVLTTEGQGRAADPVGFGIPVMIDGPWAQPRIYPDMAGILDNPDAAYAKLKEMGKGLFGTDGGGLSGLLGGAGSLAADGNAGGARRRVGLSDPLGGKLGETLGNLIQQGLGQGGLGRSGPAPAPAAARAAAFRAQPRPSRRCRRHQRRRRDVPQPAGQPAMNDVLRQLFNR